ncbi:unnamed protein product [Rhizoctonia solani]|uniref:Uncharacterized protein n=1 Tax=Rhizoctonia solani TaxID=456999 RepID=A0A8H2XYV4_9AGAM|nr:unnamed protein product [Rhizoctonia solani]
MLLTEAKGDTDRLLLGMSLAGLVKRAKSQLGEQAGFMFGNERFQKQLYVICMGIAAEAWAYGIFYRSERPANFREKKTWNLPSEEWSPTLLWGTNESDEMFDGMVNHAARLLTLMDITRE